MALGTGRGIRLVALVVALLVTGVALAHAPLPRPGGAYQAAAGRGAGAVAIRFVVSPRSARRLEPIGSGDSGAHRAGTGTGTGTGTGAGTGAGPGAAPGAAVTIRCPAAPRAGRAAGEPYVALGLPAATLRQADDQYRFAVSETVRDARITGSRLRPLTLGVRITGVIASPTAITGTVTVRGGPCSTPRALRYRARLYSAHRARRRV